MSQTIARPRRVSTPRTRSMPPRSINATSLRQLWGWLLPMVWLSGSVLHGNTQWTPSHLVIQALCWTWSPSRGRTSAFDEALEWCRALRVGPAVTTYQGLMGALVKWSPALIRDVLTAFRRRMATLGSRFWRTGSWALIAFDGSRSSTPRTTSNERAFCAPNYGTGQTAKYKKKKTRGMRRKNNEKNKAQPPQPQVWMTLLWHVGLRLPWAWRLGPSNSSEREHVMDMLATETFPDRTLFCGDAGFIGYPLWSRIQARGHDFLVRAGANVHLLVAGGKGRITPHEDQPVLSWPLEAQREGLPPLQLRLIRARIKKTKVWMLTSVLDRTQLTRARAVELYQQRWGVEVAFRGLKQTLARGELRCRNEKRVLIELDWALLGMAVVELWALKAQLDRRATKTKTKTKTKEYSPLKRSLAHAMRALRWCLRNARNASEPGHGLTARLREAVTDDYTRRALKRARYRPVNPDKKPLGDPKLRNMTTDEKRILQNTPRKMNT